MAMAFARLARQRHVVGPALLAASTIAFVPRATVCRGTPDRFFASQQGGSEEDDVARLRRENAELKSKLARQKEPEGGGFLDGLAKTFGFGKTEVAMRASFRMVASGRQVAFLAPTTVLAAQHLRVLRKRMPPEIRVELISSIVKRKPGELQQARRGE